MGCGDGAGGGEGRPPLLTSQAASRVAAIVIELCPHSPHHPQCLSLHRTCPGKRKRTVGRVVAGRRETSMRQEGLGSRLSSLGVVTVLCEESN